MHIGQAAPHLIQAKCDSSVSVEHAINCTRMRKETTRQPCGFYITGDREDGVERN